MINTALNYLSFGLSVIPVKSDTKAPTVASWKQYQSERMQPDKAWELFNDSHAIAVIAGTVSGGLEIIDFDNHFRDASSILSRFCKMVDVSGLLIQATPSGGYHVMYRCPQPAKNLKLAMRLNPSGIAEALIETRGEGGYALIAPSPRYTVKKGSFSELPMLTQEQRDDLIATARAFNEYERPNQVYSHDTFSKDTDRPGDEYNESQDGRDEVPILLSRQGWKSTDGRHWTRPGKATGVSATWGKVTAGAVPLFYCFTSGGGQFESLRSYKPFQIFALLAHNGDFDQAAKELRQRGFGKDQPNSKELYVMTMKSVREGVSQPNYAAISKELNLPESDVRKQVDKIYEQNQDEFNFEKKTEIEKVEIYLNKNFEFRKNVVTQKTEMRVKSGEWTRMNDNTIYCDFQRKKIKFTFDKLKALLRSDFVPEFDPFLEYFNSLPSWDGVDYVQQLADHIKGPDPQWFALMLLKHLVRAVKCAIEPGYYNRIVFTLVSEEQEIGKSYFIRYLNPFGLDYYSEEFLRDDKDSQFRLSENFLYNLEELDTLNKMDIGKLKAMISKQGVNERVPYEAQKIALPRRCTFFGSTNRSEFLLDDRNTRWMVFNVTDFDRAYSTKINVQDVWAQVWAHYNNPDFNCELERDEAIWRDQANKAFQIQETERTVILQNIERATEEGEFMTNVDVMTLIVDVTGNKLKLTQSPQKIGRIMSELGFQTGQRIINGKNCRVYYCRAKNYLKRNTKEEAPF